MRTLRVLLVSVILTLVSNYAASAFSLRGPIGSTNGPVDGAVNIGEGYRWNVPLVTYAYDQSFLNFFGTNGIAAVESAMQLLNALPAASALDPNSYPTNVGNVLNNPPFSTNVQLIDLRSAALSLVVREMGLASPEKSMFGLQQSVSGGITNYNLIVRNFDPITDAPSSNLNGAVHTSVLITNAATGQVALAQSAQSAANITVTGFADFLGPNWFVTQLSYDDVGGLRYLLSTNNVALESLIPGVQGVGTNASNFVTTALRPGVDKITFQRVTLNSIFKQVFPPVTNQYVDTYISNRVTHQQNVARVITQPDVLFTAVSSTDNVNFTNSSSTNWVNNSLTSGNGPGVVQSPIVIAFNRVGVRLLNRYNPAGGYSVITTPPWGSFNFSTNGAALVYSNAVNYPITASPSASFDLQFYKSSSSVHPASQFSWQLPGTVGTSYMLQYSEDLANWTNIISITNSGWDVTCMEQLTNSVHRYFRTVPQGQ